MRKSARWWIYTCIKWGAANATSGCIPEISADNVDAGCIYCNSSLACTADARTGQATCGADVEDTGDDEEDDGSQVLHT